MDMKFVLTRKQVEQLHSLFNEEGMVTDQVEIVGDNGNGIGQHLCARYVCADLRIRQIDISDYESW
jgi:hypothetical protein